MRARMHSAGLRGSQFCDKLGPDLRHVIPRRGVSGWVPWVDGAERCHEDPSGCQVAEPPMVGWHDVPRCPWRAGMTQHAVEGALVVVPVASLPDVAGRELPVLFRVVDAL